MRFRGLPLDLNTGGVDLNEDENIRGEWPICQYCGVVSVKFFKCATQSHTMCSDCLTVSNMYPDETRKSWCGSCSDWALVHKSTIPIDSLIDAMFICGCGFRGTLAHIRQHLRSASDLKRCFNAPESSETGRILNDRSVLQNELNIVKEKLSKSASPRGRTSGEVVSHGEFLYYQWMIFSNGHYEEHLSVSGVPLKVRLEVHTKDNKLWVGLGVASSTHLPSGSSVWPLKKLILLTVRNDETGFSVTRGIKTFKDHRFVSQAFVEPSDTTTTVGWRLFCPFADIFQGGSTDFFKVHVSLNDLPEG